MSVPDTWVTFHIGDMGNTFGPKGVALAARARMFRRILTLLLNGSSSKTNPDLCISDLMRKRLDQVAFRSRRTEPYCLRSRMSSLPTSSFDRHVDSTSATRAAKRGSPL